MAQKIRKVIIPVAGWGTRFLPATKAQPKEMLPIVDTPIIQHVVEQAVASGIEEVILVTGASKRAVEDHFDYNYALEEHLEKQNKPDLLLEIRRIAEMATFVYVRQKGPYGNGTPVLSARDLIGNEPFAVMWGDEFFFSDYKPHLRQLIDVYEKYEQPVLTAYEVSSRDVEKYGILDASLIQDGIFQVKRIVEKPKQAEAPSNLASLGGYILTPDIFDILANLPLGKGGELWLTDAIAKLLEKRPIYACLVNGTYYDTGSKLGYLKANVDTALRRDDLKDDLLAYLKTKIQ